MDSKNGGKLKIAFLIDTISCNTAVTQKQLLETITRIDRTHFSPYLVCLWKSEWMANNALPCPCTVLNYKGLLKPGLPAVVLRLRRLIRKEQIDIVQTFFTDSIFVAFLANLISHPAPAFLSSRRDMGLGEHSEPWYHKFFALALPFVNRYFTGLISNCEQVRQYVAVREKVSLEKIKTIMNGVDLPDSTEVIPPVFKHNDADIVWIGLAASLTPVKRHDILLKAFAILGSRDLPKPVHLVLLGEGPERNTLENLCSKLGLENAVHFLGAVTNIVSYLRNIDICVLCSDREGLSNAILEYMACGKPVVATAVGGNIELVNDRNGILVPPGDPIALADALYKLVMDGDKRIAMGDVSLQRVREEFSWDRAISELEDYYRQLVGVS